MSRLLNGNTDGHFTFKLFSEGLILNRQNIANVRQTQINEFWATEAALTTVNIVWLD